MNDKRETNSDNNGIIPSVLVTDNSVPTTGDSDFHDGVVSSSDNEINNETNNESEINDAGLLRSMLEESEEYYANLEAADANEEKKCWVCFATEMDDTTAVWVHPCRCRGSTKWVHQACIQRWVDEKQKGNSSAQVECPQCQTGYVIKFPKGNLIVTILDTTDKLVQRLCPIVAGAVLVGSVYWTCVTFGAVTVMQVVGHEKGLVFMERADPLFLLVSLPLVPVGLVLGKMIRWEEPVLKMLRASVPKIPLSRYILPSFAYVPERQALQASLPPMTDAVSVTRTLCGALFFPSVACFLGAALYDSEQFPSQLKRTLLGGLTFVVIKGVFKVYHKQHTFLRQCQRVIMDHNELPSSQTTSTTQTVQNSNSSS